MASSENITANLSNRNVSNRKGMSLPATQQSSAGLIADSLLQDHLLQKLDLVLPL
jgi:hypothetical protein